jgi:hypothetical protein
MRPRLFVMAWLVLLAAPSCDGEREDDGRSGAPAQEPGPAAPAREPAPATPAPPPDAGTQRGHAADRSRRVEVPDADDSPPHATVVLSRPPGGPAARASQPGSAPHGRVRLDRLRLRGTTVGRDANGGVARVRVSIKERIRCRRHGTGATYARLRTRYFPPPQVERIRSSPGAVLPTRRVRSVRLGLGDRCGHGAAPVLVHGELWGEAVNGSGLEAVTPHIRFTYLRPE